VSDFQGGGGGGAGIRGWPRLGRAGGVAPEPAVLAGPGARLGHPWAAILSSPTKPAHRILCGPWRRLLHRAVPGVHHPLRLVSLK
jgi:hypothetical protein